MAQAGWNRTSKSHDGKVNQRRSRRVVQSVRVKVSWLADDGKPIEHDAETLVISQHGARIHTDLPLQLGATVKLTVLSTGSAADAVVTWVSPESPYEFGVELTKAIDIWGANSSSPAAAASPSR